MRRKQVHIMLKLTCCLARLDELDELGELTLAFLFLS